MLDLTSSLYLGMRHDSRTVPAWASLTTGVPTALAAAPAAVTVAAGLARLTGMSSATLASSTLHAFWDLFPAIGARQIYVDTGTYPIGRWGAERARCTGATVRIFPHHDPAALDRAVTSAGRHGPIVLTDGLCPGCGRVAPVGDYLAVAGKHGGSVVIDDTQALAVLGTPAPGHPYGTGGGGTARWAALGDARLIVVASLAKGFGVPVAVVASSQPVVRRFEAKAETRVHCSPPSNAHLSAAAHALSCNAARGDELRGYLARLVARFRRLAKEWGVPLGAGLFPIQTIRPGTGLDPRVVYRRLGELGIRTVLHVPRCRPGPVLSVIFTAAHREADVDQVIRALATVVTDGRRRAVVVTR